MSKKEDPDTGAYTFKKEDFKYKKGRYWIYQDKHIVILIHKVRKRIADRFRSSPLFVCTYFSRHPDQRRSTLYDSFVSYSFKRIIDRLNSRYLDC